tara:strand:+ start:3901 stop:4293 length:393 start_codon:yes stop_codon:yes gene_type:complete
MGNVQTINKVTYETIQEISLHRRDTFMICTISSEKEKYVILNTVPISKEESIINDLIVNRQFQKKIIIYGENMYDERIIKKYNQLKTFGFQNCYIYFGGLFEWILLQDVYGTELFPTNSISINGCLDFKP